MAEERPKRKLTAILSADVKGYSRLMGEDERGTVETLKRYRQIIGSLVMDYHGRVIDSPGDNILSEFSSVVDAVECGVKIQEEVKAKNSALPENRRMEFRIGVNLGDVIEDEDRIYGDGVNVAARIESLAEGGGICISGTAFDQVEGKLELEFEYLGEQAVKNIKKPVRVYRAEMKGGVSGVKIRREFSLPDKPSIAVLPFANMSGDAGQQYFSDGITEQIITGLSKVPKLFVIARTSSFKYKGREVDIRTVGRELGVRYVLEGSVQKSGNRLRITAQLIDAIDGHHLWSERYDRDLKDIFDLQDDISIKIMTSMQVKLTVGEQQRALERGTKKFEAYIKYIQAYEVFFKINKEDNILAQKLANEAIVIDPDFGLAYSVLGWTYLFETLLGYSKSPEQSLSQAMDLAKKALTLHDSLDCAHGLLASCYRLNGEYEKAVAESRKSVEIAPNSERSHNYLGYNLIAAGRSEEAIPSFERAMRLSPFPTSNVFVNFGIAHLFTGRYEEAISMCKKATNRNPNDFFAQLVLASAYSASGLEEKARAAANEILRINPKFSVEFFSKMAKYKKQEDKELLIGGLRKAGLPD